MPMCSLRTGAISSCIDVRCLSLYVSFLLVNEKKLFWPMACKNITRLEGRYTERVDRVTEIM